MMNWIRGTPSPQSSPQAQAQPPAPQGKGTPASLDPIRAESPRPDGDADEVTSPIHSDRKDVEPLEDQGTVPISNDEADEVLNEGQTSLIMQLIKSGQLQIGIDLTKVVLPTFILEPRGLLEKISDFWMHPQIFMEMSDPTPLPGFNADVTRMIRVAKWYMSGFHIRPRGVKKPYNPILGEMFECEIAVPGAGPESTVLYVAEQVTHHPPVTAFYARGGSVSMHGMYYPRSKFLGNSAASIGEGSSTLLFDDGQVYNCTWPTVYVRGIVFGRLLMEVGGKVEITCPSTGVQADIDFKVKGYFGGDYNVMAGNIYYVSKGYRNPEVNLGGKWTETLTYTPARDKKVVQPLADLSKAPLGTRTVTNSSGIPDELMSRNVWAKVTAALQVNDVEAATKEKNVVEAAQRETRKDLAAKGEDHKLRLFTDIHPQTDPHATRTYGKVLHWIYTGPGAKRHPHTDKLLAEAAAEAAARALEEEEL